MLCTNGPRKDQVPWELAEMAALAAARLHLELKGLVRSLTDIVITQSRDKDKERRERVVKLGLRPPCLEPLEPQRLGG